MIKKFNLKYSDLFVTAEVDICPKDESVGILSHGYNLLTVYDDNGNDITDRIEENPNDLGSQEFFDDLFDLITVGPHSAAHQSNATEEQYVLKSTTASALLATINWAWASTDELMSEVKKQIEELMRDAAKDSTLSAEAAKRYGEDLQ